MIEIEKGTVGGDGILKGAGVKEQVPIYRKMKYN